MKLSQGKNLKKKKTSLFFNKNTSREVQDQVKQMFGAQIIKHHEKYLGLPSLVGWAKEKHSTKSKFKWVGK